MSQEEALYAVAIGVCVVVVVVVVAAIRRGAGGLGQGASALDAEVDGIIASVLAPHVPGASHAAVLAAIREPTLHPDLAAHIRAMVLKSELSVQRVDGEWAAKVDVWRVGDDPEKVVHSSTSFSIQWDELHDVVREQLLRDGGEVVIPWNVAEPSSTSR